MEIKQNTLFLTTSGNYIHRDHLTLRIEAENQLKLAIPVHHIDSICNFGNNIFTPQALQLCWENGIAVNFFSESGYFYGRWEGVPNTSVMLRRTQYRRADDKEFCVQLSKHIVRGKIRNCRNSLLRSARTNESPDEAEILKNAVEELRLILQRLQDAQTLDQVRGFEGQAADIYFKVFDFHLRWQRESFRFEKRSRRPPLNLMNCLLSFLYALLCHDCISALTAVGLDPFVGFFHTDRPNRPSLALDLMEEFRPVLADRLAISLINLRQIQETDFLKREGGVVELTKEGRKKLLSAYQLRKHEKFTHPLLGQEYYLNQVFIVQARILARYLRGDIPEYYPFVQK